jgi:type IV secretory pathway TrbL component
MNAIVLNYTSAAASGNSTQGNATESGGASSSASSTFSSASSTFSSASSTFSSASSTFTSGNTGNTATGSQGAFPAPSNTTSSSILSANDPTLVSLFFILSSTCLFFIYCV